MGRQDKMLENRRKNSEMMLERVISTIDEMLNEEKQVTVSALRKKTGLSRAYFYNNKKVHDALVRAQELQEGKSFVTPQKVVIDKAMDREIEVLKRKLAEKDLEIASLKKEIIELEKLGKNKLIETINSI